MEAIVSAKQKERLKELERKKLEIAAEHDRKLQQDAEEHRALHEDNQLRKASVRFRGRLSFSDYHVDEKTIRSLFYR